MAKIYSDSQKDILRQTPIVAMMAYMGYKFPSGKAGGIFHSPFRDDANPSFHITHQVKTDVFFDHGSDRISGDSYDFAKLLLEHAGRDTSGVAVWDFLAEFHPGIIPEEKTSSKVNGGWRNPGSHGKVQAGAVESHSGPSVSPLAGYVCHSGGAKGSDYAWGVMAEKNGMKVRAYWYSEKTWALQGYNPQGMPHWGVEISDDDYKEGVEASEIANRTLNRMPPRSMKATTRHLIARNWFQVKNADAVYAVGSFLTPKIVDGGTGWAVQMAIDNRKPVYFYNQDELQWYKVIYNGKDYRFDKIQAAPVLTKNFAGIGTRELSDEGLDAIKQSFENTRKSFLAVPSNTDDVKAAVSEDEGIDVWYSDGEKGNAILSNLAPCEFYYGGRTWDSVEKAYQYAKAVTFKDEDSARRILDAKDGYEAKQIGGKVSNFDEKIWSDMSATLLHDIIYASCLSDLDKAKALLATGDRPITHKKGGRIHSVLFPKIIMDVRSEIRGLFSNEHSFDVKNEDSSVSITKQPVKGLKLDTLKKFYTEVKMIPESVCDKDLYTVSFLFNGKTKPRYAAGNPTISGGFNLRCPDWVSSDGKPMKGMKIFAGHADISIQNAKGEYYSKMPDAATSENAIVFEGITDYMAWKANCKYAQPGVDVVILNSVSNISRAEMFLAAHAGVVLCFDNDAAGQKATEDLAVSLLGKGVKVADLRPVFACNEPTVRLVVDDEKGLCVSTSKELTDRVPFGEFWSGRLGNGPGDYNEYRIERLKKAKSESHDLNSDNQIKIK